MSTFNYTARDHDNQIISGVVSATDRTTAMQTIRAQGLSPILIKAGEEASKLGRLGSIKLGGKVKTKDLVVFTRQLATMINAGVPMARSLNTLQTQTENKAFKEKLGQIAKKVESGIGLGKALAEHPEVFSNIYINMVSAGEEGGILDEVLNRLALQVEKDAEIKHKVKSAMAYPVVVSVITLVAFFGLMTFVIPKLGAIIQNIGGELPTLTRVMLSISSFMRSPIFIALAFIGGPLAIFGLRRYLRTDEGLYQFHRILLKLPIVKVFITKVAIARFSRIFSSLMAAGVTVLVSIETTSSAIGNKVIERELLGASEKVRNGVPLSVSLAGSQVFPPIVSQMLAIGEETGQIDKILVKVAEYYETEVDTFVNALSSIIEPLMILVLGAIVGLVAASVFGPLTSLTQSIK